MARTAVLIGRFQPLHKAHVELITRALQGADFLLVLIGSSDVWGRLRNPFCAEDRKTLLQSVFPSDSVEFCFLDDSAYNYKDWVLRARKLVHQAVRRHFPENSELSPEAIDASIIFYGHDKDDSTWYLKLFPEWSYESVPLLQNGISSTAVREALFLENWALLENLLPGETLSFLRNWVQTEAFAVLKEEYSFLRSDQSKNSYRNIWEYALLLVRANYIFVQKRTHLPGRSLFQLPSMLGMVGEAVPSEMPGDIFKNLGFSEWPERTFTQLASWDFTGAYRDSRGLKGLRVFLVQENLKNSDAACMSNKGFWFDLASLDQHKNAFFEDQARVIQFFVNHWACWGEKA